MKKKLKVMTARFPGHGGRSHYHDHPKDLEVVSDSSDSSSSVDLTATLELTKKKPEWTPLPDECSVLISVGKEHFKGLYLKALIGSLDRTFKRSKFIVAGTLQRYNKAIIRGVSPKKAYDDAKTQEDAFIALAKEHVQQLRSLKQALHVVQPACEFEYTPWDKYSKSTAFARRLSEVNKLLTTDPFKDELAKTVSEFSEKHLYENFFLRKRHEAGQSIPETQPTAAFFRKCFETFSKEDIAKFSDAIFSGKKKLLRPDTFLREYFKMAPKEEQAAFIEVFKTNSQTFLAIECAAMWQWEGLIVYPSGASPILQAMTDHINEARDKARKLDENATVPKNISWQAVKRKDSTIKSFQEVISAAGEEHASFLDTALLQLPADQIKQLIGDKLNGTQRKNKSVAVVSDVNSTIGFYSMSKQQQESNLTQMNIQQHQSKLKGKPQSKQEQTNNWFVGVTADLQVQYISILAEQPNDRKAFWAQLSFLKGMINGLQSELSLYSASKHSVCTPQGTTFSTL